MNRLSTVQSEALVKARRHFGRCWKAQLRRCWLQAHYPSALRDAAPYLQQLRNTLGPSGLCTLKLKQ